jgi:hypothetical protein
MVGQQPTTQGKHGPTVADVEQSVGTHRVDVSEPVDLDTVSQAVAESMSSPSASGDSPAASRWA